MPQVIPASSGFNRTGGDALNERAHSEGEQEQQGQASQRVAGKGRAIVEVVLSRELGHADREGLDVVVGKSDERPPVSP